MRHYGKIFSQFQASLLYSIQGIVRDFGRSFSVTIWYQTTGWNDY